jgi:hypothetical protein
MKYGRANVSGEVREAMERLAFSNLCGFPNKKTRKEKTSSLSGRSYHGSWRFEIPSPAACLVFRPPPFTKETYWCSSRINLGSILSGSCTSSSLFAAAYAADA